MKAKTQLHMGVGTISLLMIFVVLCMVILASLSFLTAKGSLDLAIREKEEVTSYYEADASAVYLVQHFDAKKSLNENYEQLSTLALSKEQEIDVELEEASILILIPMEHEKQLQVRIQSDGTTTAWGVVHEKGETL